eukprot:scaffold56567_cov35-Tisochrysis_lutea.AAC.8
MSCESTAKWKIEQTAQVRSGQRSKRRLGQCASTWSAKTALSQAQAGRARMHGARNPVVQNFGGVNCAWAGQGAWPALHPPAPARCGGALALRAPSR